MKNLIPHFIQQQYQKGNLQSHFSAYTMFIDLTGFATLTEALMSKGNEGAEQLSISLNDIFEPMVEEVYRRGGFIPYFAGDAFTAIFPKKSSDISAEGLMHTAIQVTKQFEAGGLKIKNYGTFQIGVKIGLSVGDVVWGIVGGKHKTFYFRGSGVDACLAAQHYAKEGQIIFDERIKELLELPNIVQVQKGFYLFQGELNASFTTETFQSQEALDSKIAKYFLPQEVMHYKQRGEFRLVVSVFISFKGVDTHKVINEFSSIILDEVQNFSGYLKELEFGDKGGVFAIFFGAPVSFENNIERALEFILSIQQCVRSSPSLDGVQFRAGITSGTAFTGIVGGEKRCQYAAVGNRVNVAARLMIFADWEEILVDEVIRKNKLFQFVHTGDIQYKGIAENIPTYKLIGRKVEEAYFFSGEMVGRESELEQLIKFAEPLFNNQFAGVAYIYGEAGLGKSRLTFELRQALEKAGEIKWLACPADQILRKSFNPFIYFLKTHFSYSPEQNAVENKHAFELQFRELVKELETVGTDATTEIIKELIRTKSILAGMIGINYSNSLWEQLDARGRFQNELSALTNLFIGESLIRPAVMFLEDGHWFDNSSKVFLSELSRKFSDYPMLILVPSRYNDDGSRPVLFDRGVLEVHHLPILELDLKMFEKNTLEQFAEKRLNGKVSKSFLQILQKATNGNPFYTEQVIEYFSESDFLLKESGVWNIKNKNIKLSSSINAILMARIDRLSLLVKETVKAAAVIGREFEIPVLSEVLKESEVYQNENGNQLSLLHQQIKIAEQGQVWRSTNNNLRYLFQHALLREAVYEMQLHARLRQIHRLIAEAIERLYEDDLERQYFDLAFHYEHADILEKTILYQRLAAANAVRNFQNTQAHELYEKLIKSCRAIGNEEGVIDALLFKSKIEEHIGEWEACEASLNEALKLAQRNNNLILLGKANNQLGKLIMLKGKYEEAGMHLETAIAFFMDVSDEGGMCEAFGNMGNLFFRQGKYEDAKSFFIDSISIAQKNPEIILNSQIVANLGLTHMNQGNYEEGIECQRVPLFLSEQRKDKPTMAILYTHMGIVYLEKGAYKEALVYLEKGLAISEALGNKQLKAIAIGSIGSVYEKRGDFQKAMANYKNDLELCLELGDKQGTAIALGLIGELHNTMGAFDKAVEYLERKYILCKELNYQKGIAKTVNALGDIFSYKNEFEKAIASYTQAVDVSRAIDNKLVLGFSLVELGDVQLRMKGIEDTKTSYQEALNIAKPLGNPDLLFEVQILGAKLEHVTGDSQKAIKDLKELLKQELEEKELAATHYELNKILPTDDVHRNKAYQLYQKLYKASPQFLFKLRLDALKKRV